jgi:hypothetical protein
MFNKETEYALRGLVYIKLQNLNNRRPGTAEVAKEIEERKLRHLLFLQRKYCSALSEADFSNHLKGKEEVFTSIHRKLTLH